MEFINFNDNLYLVYRKAKEKFMNKPGMAEFVKEMWHCDTILKQNDILLFCRKIDDAVIEEEIKN